MYTKYIELRDKKGVNNTQVAHAIGVPPSTIYDWEQRCRKKPDTNLSVANLVKVAKYFGVSVEEFL